MGTLKTIGNKLFKAELSNQKVELALTDDFDKLFNKGKGNSSIFGLC